MRGRVKLPSGLLIPCREFCRAIADAVCPIDQHFEGINCVWAKIYTTDAPPRGFGKGVPYPLTETDQQELVTVLQKLPPLLCPMSEEETASFMKDYLSLPGRPEWEPLLETEDGVRERKNRHSQVMSRLTEVIQKEHMEERLVLVNVRHLPVQTVQFDTHLTRKDAIAYLERHGLPYDNEETGKSAKQDTLSSEAADQSPNAGQMTLTGKPKRGVIRFSAATKAKAVKRCKELMVAGEAKYAKITADEFKTTERSIYTWVKEAEKADPLTYLRGRSNN